MLREILRQIGTGTTQCSSFTLSADMPLLIDYDLKSTEMDITGTYYIANNFEYETNLNKYTGYYGNGNGLSSATLLNYGSNITNIESYPGNGGVYGYVSPVNVYLMKVSSSQTSATLCSNGKCGNMIAVGDTSATPSSMIFALVLLKFTWGNTYNFIYLVSIRWVPTSSSSGASGGTNYTFGAASKLSIGTYPNGYVSASISGSAKIIWINDIKTPGKSLSSTISTTFNTTTSSSRTWSSFKTWSFSVNHNGVSRTLTIYLGTGYIYNN